MPGYFVRSFFYFQNGLHRNKKNRGFVISLFCVVSCDS